MSDRAKLRCHKGNLEYEKKHYSKALEFYSEAISFDATIAGYWSNRAGCHARMGHWELVEADCKSALQLDGSDIRAHYLLGLKHNHCKQFQDAIHSLKQALELVRSADNRGNRDFRKRISAALEIARSSMLTEFSEANVAKLEEVMQACLLGIAAKQSEISADNLPSKRKREQEEDPSMGKEEMVKIVEQVFSEAKRKILSSVPEFLKCNITFDILKEPVITPTGMTYERKALEHHITKLNNDPTSYKKLESHQIYPNLAIKKAVQQYREEHGDKYY